MDKNMLNIDDLFKERLANGEETARPGAWLQMRELLDKEMPEDKKLPVAAFNWRRMFGYAAALLLLSAVSIGGYQMISSQKESKAAYDSIVPEMPKETTMGAINNNVKDKNDNTTDNTLGDTSNPFRTNDNTEFAENNTLGENSRGLVERGTSKQGSAQDISTTNNNKATQSNTDNNTPEEDGKLLTNRAKTALIASISSDKSRNAAVLTETINRNKSQQEPIAGNRQFGSSAKASGTTGNSNISRDMAKNTRANKPGVTAGNTSKNNKTNSGNNNSQSVTPQASGKNSKKPVSNNINPDYLVAKQVVPTIQVRQTYDRKEGWKSDTSKGQTEMEVLVPTEKKPVDMIAAEKQNNNIASISEQPAKPSRPMITVREEDNIPTPIVPASGITLAANAENAKESLLPLDNFKVSSKQSANYARTNLIEQMVKNAKVNLGSAKFYGGIIGGLNTSLSGNNSIWGFQLGLSGTLSLNERWGIVSELKYLHRFNSKPLRNDGFANLDSAHINSVTTYTWDSVNRSFKFPTVSAMELPVYIRYSLNRLNFHAGMNLVYNFTINSIDIDSFGIRKTNNEGPVVQGAVNYSFNDGVPRIAIDDFSSRFSLGYLFGVGYQFTPAIQLDVRMTKSFWDNAKTNGAKEVSKQIYDVPSVQVNLNYRFGSNKFKPYHR